MRNALCLLVGLLVLAGQGWSEMKSSVSQWGITWTFDTSYECGQFVNGDWWVIGPVSVTAISKPHNQAGHDGSMINPMGGGGQGYDNQLGSYQTALDVSRTLPLALGVNRSLVSTITWVPGDAGCPAINATTNAPRPTGRAAAVLTCLAGAPPTDAFRPPACGTEKPLYCASQLHRELLPKYKTVTAMPALATVERYVERVWLDHVPEWNGAYLIPSENMQHYGRDVSQQMNDVLQMLMLDLPDKERLLVRAVQAGIDLFGSMKSGQYWGTWGGGWSHGRKMPILFAGIMLDVDEMKNIGATYTQTAACNDATAAGSRACHRFMEDCQTFYVSGRTTGWGGRHCSRDEYDMANSYRFCCTSYTWPGAMLTALMLRDTDGVSVKTLWNWDAFFDYVDFWVQEQGVDVQATFINNFSRAMWKAYRNNIVPVGTEGRVRHAKQTPAGVRLLSNPVTQQAVFMREGTEAGEMAVTIYDRSGVLVRALWSVQGTVVWDGRDMSGTRGRPGIYMFTAGTGVEAVRGRLVKVR